MKKFDPNGIAIPNGNYFALPYSIEESKIVIIPTPWDVTTSYREGTHMAPESIMEASYQIDLYDSRIKRAWESKIATHPLERALLKENRKYRKMALEVIERLESGEEIERDNHLLIAINRASEKLNRWVEEVATSYLKRGQIPLILGGDHSVPLGSIKAVANFHDQFGILHIDAHADLRKAYEGFTYSHASIFYNALEQVAQLSQLTQVGVRDFCAEEANLIDNEPRIRSFTDIEIKEGAFTGKSWSSQCDEIISTLPQKLYISFDIDGLSPHLCPNTGTPVPGGLSFSEIDYLLWRVASSGREIIGADLCEVGSNQEQEWDSIVGARILYKLALYINYSYSNGKNQ